MAVDTAHEDPRITPLREALNAIELTPITGVSFIDETIHLDGRQFIRCVFRNCRLFTSTGRFDLIDTQLTTPVRYEVEQPGARLIETHYLMQTKMAEVEQAMQADLGDAKRH